MRRRHGRGNTWWCFRRYNSVAHFPFLGVQKHICSDTTDYDYDQDTNGYQFFDVHVFPFPSKSHSSINIGWFTRTR
jgi:hypothetical protein